MQEQQPPIPHLGVNTPPQPEQERDPNEFTEVDAQAIAIEALQARANSAAKMLNYVAAFSLVNTILGMLKMPFGLAFGLNVTDLIDGVAKYYKSPFMGLLFDLIPVGFYFLMAFLMKKQWGWFIVAMLFYLVDGLIGFIYLKGNIVNFLISTAVHGYVLYILWQGMTASRAANNLRLMPSSPDR